MSSIVRYCYLDIAPCYSSFFFFFNDTATTEIYTLSLHDALPIWSAQLDVAVERLEFGAGAARSDREAEPVLARFRDAHGEAGVEVAVERRHRHRHVGPLRNAHRYVAVVRSEAVVAAVLDGAVVVDVAAHRADLDARGLDPLQRDVAAHSFSRDVAAHVLQGHRLVHRIDVDVPLGVLQHDRSLHRLEGQLAAAAAHFDFAVDRLGGDPRLRALHLEFGREP